MWYELLDWIETNWKLIALVVGITVAIFLGIHHLAQSAPNNSFIWWLRIHEKSITRWEAGIGTVILIIAAAGFAYKKATGEW